MAADKYEIVTTTETTPEHDKVTGKQYVRYDDKGNPYLSGVHYKTQEEKTLMPDEETIGLFNEHIVPSLAKKHGVTVKEDGEIDTPLSRLMPYDVEAERKRREKEKELNEFKRKEANWYNGISVLMDIAGAAAGARVQKRTPTDVAAQAVAANEALRKEGLAEEVAIEQAKQKKAAEYWKDWSDQFNKLYRKVSTTTEDKPHTITTTHVPEVRKTKGNVVKLGGKDGNDNGGGNGSARYLGYTVMVNGKPENRSIPMNIGTYNKIGEDLIAHYRKLYNESTGDERRAIENALANLGIRVKTKGGYEWRADAAMSQGLFYKLPEELKKEIIEKANGEIEFVEGANGMDVIQPKGAARPFIPTTEGDEEVEELMGS